MTNEIKSWLTQLESIGDYDVRKITRILAKQLEADARALWAVRVLDAWRRAKAERGWSMPGTQFFAQEAVRLFDSEEGPGRQVFRGRTEDAARLAAADAVFDTLPADVRATLGERP
jgi:hypothetical protein